MQHKSPEANETEHPWIRQARSAKKSCHQQDDQSVDEVQLPETPRPISYWGPICVILLLLVMAGLSLRFAMISHRDETIAQTNIIHLWHHGSESEARILQDMIDTFSDRSGIHVALSVYDPRRNAVMGSMYGQDRPDVMIVDSLLAEQLAYSNSLLTLQGGSLLYGVPVTDDYFLPLTTGGEFIRPIGVIIPRTTRNADLAQELVAHFRTLVDSLAASHP